MQGERISTQSIEIDPNYVYKKNSESDSSSESNDDEEGISVRFQPTPSSQLLVKRRRRRQRRSLACDGEENSESELTEESVGSPLQEEEIDETEYVPYKTQRGRPRRLSSVRSISSLGVEDRMVLSELKESGADHVVVKPPLDQRRHVSTLFLPSSPLLNENLKVRILCNKIYVQLLVSHWPCIYTSMYSCAVFMCVHVSFTTHGVNLKPYTL